MSQHKKLQANELPNCIPQQSLAIVLSHLFKQWLHERKAGVVRQQPRHHSYLVCYYKSFQLKNRLLVISPRTGSLSKLKSQFAKKPKNPV